MKWRFFIGASLMVGYGMYAAGGPLGAIAAGIAFAAILNFVSQRKKRTNSPARTVNP
jgi:F0F1-type ATP synthase membrane subunit c/vacuolar-type H+-ATPase subunit K